MSKVWLNIIGIGEDGLDGLRSSTKFILESAEILIGGERHHNLTSELNVERIYWPKPFNLMYEKIKSYRGKKVVILVTGDPLWFSVGVKIGSLFDSTELTYHPHISAFQNAAVRMNWPLEDVETTTVHGRPLERIIPFFQPNQKLLVLTSGSETPKQVAELLTSKGFGNSKLTVLSSMGGEDEQLFSGEAKNWNESVPSFNTLAIECVSSIKASFQTRLPGLPDHIFQSDGTMTKQEVRAITVAKLKPVGNALLWDVGCGCGTVAIEWMRAAPSSRAIGIDARLDRCELTSINALNLGVPDLRVIQGNVPSALRELDPPNAIFIGGGFTKETFDLCWAELKSMGRLVVNAVTLESEALLLNLYKNYGGELTKISINRVESIGNSAVWKPFKPITQWSLEKQ